MQDRYPSIYDIKELFPDTTVSVLKECFEALQLYDFVEFLEKVRPRSLRPALTSEQAEKLQITDDRLANYHSNVAVLVINHIFEGTNVKRDNEEEIEAFFKTLNPRNEVTITSVTVLRETRKSLRETAWKKQEGNNLKLDEKYTRNELEIELPREKERLEKKPEMQMGKAGNSKSRRIYSGSLLSPIETLKQQESRLRRKLDDCIEESAKLREQIERNIEKVKEQVKEAGKAVSTAMDKLIHNQETFTCLAVFVISEERLFKEFIEGVFDECVVKKLALLPDHPKLVVGPSGWKSISEVPETLYASYPANEWHSSLIFTWMIEIFNKRWQTLDLIAMMQELKRTSLTKVKAIITIQDNWSTRLRFQKTEENSSLKETSGIAADI